MLGQSLDVSEPNSTGAQFYILAFYISRALNSRKLFLSTWQIPEQRILLSVVPQLPPPPPPPLCSEKVELRDGWRYEGSQNRRVGQGRREEMLHTDNMTADITKCADSRQNKVEQTRETQHLVSLKVCRHIKTPLADFT